MKLREFGKFKELPRNIDNVKFRSFINNCWHNRYSLYDDNYLLNEDKKEQRFLIFDGNKIKARNYIGFINYEGENITIYPKIFDEKIPEDRMDSYLITNLIYWITNSEKIKLPFSKTNLDFNNINNFMEIFIYLFAKYTADLIYENPFNNYEEVEEELEFLKGRLNTSIYLKENLSTGRWNKFNCIHEPYRYNNKFNQIIKYVSKLLLNETKNKESISYLENINFILDEVEDINCTVYDCNQIKLSRVQEKYNLVLSFCEMFLGNSSIFKANNEKKLNFCFLVPMELVFEDFVYNFMKMKLSKNFKEITKQKSSLYLGDLYINDNFVSKAFNLKQDIFIRDLEDNISILDTKYKILDSMQYPKFNISQGDMYQMISYAAKSGSKNLVLVYPMVDGFSEDIKYVVNSTFLKDNIEVKVLFVNFKIAYEEYLEEVDLFKLHKKQDEIIYKEILI